MLPLPTEAITEEKTNACIDRHCPTHYWRPQIIPENLDSRINTRDCQHRRQREERNISSTKGSLGHWRLLQSKWTFDSWKLTSLSPCGVQSVSSFCRRARCIAGKTMEFSDIKINIYNCFGAILTTHACKTRAGLTDSSANRDVGLSAFDFICIPYKWE